MKKLITKKQVIEALTKEPVLKRGYFFSSEKLGCPVCAVGAVLRKVSFEKWARENNINLTYLGDRVTDGDFVGNLSDIKDCLKCGNYLGALSIYFENGNSRKKCIGFVKRNFPKRFMVRYEP